jgi:NAD(P)-dependent dehydrogenase (short-subunit alcohol dehydrogenase family)
MNEKRIALITGANKGIGLETARQLGKQNIVVLIGARDRAKGEAAAKELQQEKIDARAIQIDVAESESIRRAAEEVERQFGKLDILVNNAGVMLHGEDKSAGTQPMEVWRRTFETNVFGLIETTRAFLPLLRKSEAGRIVNVSSILGSMTYHSQPGSPIYGNHVPAYNVSKSAVNAFTVQLAYELRDTKIKVNAAHPGWVKTDLGGEEAPLDVTAGAKTSVALATLGDDGPSGHYIHMGKSLPW